MRAVSNTSPISNLAAIGRLDLLKAQFGEVWIPEAVAEELRRNPFPAAAAAIQAAIREQWVRIEIARDSALLRTLLAQLHCGEAEAIALATELKADLVLMDEREGRQLAAQSGISVTGVLGILLRAKRVGQLVAIKPEIDALRQKAHFFIAPGLEARVLAESGESELA
jgi:hypothetical protein